MPDDPLFTNASAGAPSYAANELRRAFAMLLWSGVADRFGARQGVHPSGANAVSLSGTTVTVQHTKAVVYPGLTSLAGPYIVQLQSEAFTLTAADATNPRKDIVVLQVQDNDEDSSGFRRARSFVVTGTPAPSPVEPAVPASAFKMATVDVPASPGAATLTYNSPFTIASGGILPVRNDAELLGTSGGLYDGAARWRQDTNALEVHNGAATWDVVASALGYQFWKQVRFTSSGSFNPDDVAHTGWRAARVRCQAGGAAGGGAAATAAGETSSGGGGQAGGYAESWLLRSAVVGTQTVTRGAGGTGVSAGVGNNGGTSSLGALVSAEGGNGGATVGASGTINGSAGGNSLQATTGDIGMVGQGGGFGFKGGASGGAGGIGGSSPMGGGGGASRASSGSGLPGRNYGGGGGGALNGASQAAQPGGAGGDGIVIVDLYV